MKSRIGWILLALTSACAGAWASQASSPEGQGESAPPERASEAQVPAATPAVPVSLAQTAPAAPTGQLIEVPALTAVKMKVNDQISSNTNKPGDRFRLVVAEDVRIGDAVVIPAGTTGEGEVIHAAKPGAGGKPGELLLTARFVRVGEQVVRLRSFVIGAAGEDRTTQAVATSMIAGPFAMFIRGGVIVIPIDAAATAKTLETVHLPGMQPGPTGPVAPPPQQSPETVPPAMPVEPVLEALPPAPEPGQ